MAELQTIPARHGVATFVPAGQTIKIVNTSGTQVIDTWAFALPTPEAKIDGKKDETKEEKEEKKDEQKEEPKQEQKQDEKPTPKQTPKKKKKKDADLPSQEDAEKATQNLLNQGEKRAEQKDGKQETQQKNSWTSYASSYVPSLGLSSSSSKKDGAKTEETEQQKNSRTWASYFPSGKGFSSYIPKSASDTVSAFAKDHKRDTSKSYIEQLQDFSKTPVGAAGLAAMTGSGYAGSFYAGYQAWNASHAPDAPPMEFLSMPHTRAATLHMSPKVNDTLMSNVREPMLTLVEDTSPGIHDTLMAACDPARYRGLGVNDWEHHGSCAENLVLALKELNERAGLKGAKCIGADVTINNVPAPLNLFMNIPWDDDGDLAFKAPKGKEGDYVRLRAERDVVIVMSACPQDVLEINAKKPTDGQFIVEGGDPETTQQKPQQSQKRPVPTRRPPPKKLNSDAVDSNKSGTGPTRKPIPARRTAPAKKPEGGATPAPASSAPQKKPVPKAAPQAPKKTPGQTDGDGTIQPAVEKKKPRKLSAKPKETAPAAGGE